MDYKDGITINGKHSYKDFGLYIAERNIGIPAKKVIKKTIPYMNGAYDFTMLNGVPAYEERQISYGFDITGTTVEEMEAEKASVLAWLYMAQDVDIFDDAYPETHFHGSYTSNSWDEDGCQGHLTVVFDVYPFRIANYEKVVSFNTANSTKKAINNGLPVKMKVIAPQGATVAYSGNKYAVPSGEYQLPYVLPMGDSELTVTQNDVMTFTQNSRTVNGVSFVVNSSDRYVTANGTATAQAWLYLRLQAQQGDLAVGEYRLIGSPTGGSLSTYGISLKIVKSDGTESAMRDTGGGLTFTVDKDVTSVSIGIFIANGYTANGLAFYPRLYPITKISWLEEVI